MPDKGLYNNFSNLRKKLETEVAMNPDNQELRDRLNRIRMSEGYYTEDALMGTTDKGRFDYWGIKQDDFGSRKDRRWGLIDEEGRYDPNVRANLQFARGEKQSGIGKIGNGIVKGVTTTGTTIGRTAGVLYGLGDALVEQDASLIFNNDITKAMDIVDEQLEKWCPTYRTYEQTYGNFWQRNINAAGVSDFIKNAGFTVGSAIAGNYAGIATRALTKGIAKTAVRKAINHTVPILTSTFGESGSEAATVMNSIEDSRGNEENERHMNAINEIYSKYGSNPEYANILNALIEEEEKRHNEIKSDIHREASKAGMRVFGANTVVLGTSNSVVLGAVLKGQYNPERIMTKKFLKDMGITDVKDIAGRKFTEDELKKLEKGTLKKIMYGIKSAGIEGSEELAQKIVSDRYDTWYNKKIDRDINQRLTEMDADQMIQAYGLQDDLENMDYEDSFRDYYDALYSPKAIDDTESFMHSAWMSLGQTLKDPHTADEFFAGAMLGTLGITTFGKRTNTSQSTYLGRGKFVGMSGGILGNIREMNHEEARNIAVAKAYNEAMDKAAGDNEANEFVDFMNDYFSGNAGLREAVEHLTRVSGFDNIANAGLATSDKDAYEQNRHRAMSEIVAAYQSIGALDPLLATLDINDTDLREITDAIYDEDEAGGKNLQKIEYEGKTGRDALFSSIKDNITSLKKEAEFYAKTLVHLDNATDGIFSDRQLRNLTFLRSELQYKYSNMRRNLIELDSLNRSDLTTPNEFDEKSNKFGTKLAEFLGNRLRYTRQEMKDREDYRVAELPFINESEYSDKSVENVSALVKELEDIMKGVDRESLDNVQKEAYDIIEKTLETAKSMKTYVDKFNEYMKNPEGMERDEEKARQKLDDRKRSREEKAFHKDMSKARDAADVRNAIKNEMSRRSKLNEDEQSKRFDIDDKIRSLAEEGNEGAKRYLETKETVETITEAITDKISNGTIDETTGYEMIDAVENVASSARTSEDVMNASRYAGHDANVRNGLNPIFEEVKGKRDQHKSSEEHRRNVINNNGLLNILNEMFKKMDIDTDVFNSLNENIKNDLIAYFGKIQGLIEKTKNDGGTKDNAEEAQKVTEDIIKEIEKVDSLNNLGNVLNDYKKRINEYIADNFSSSSSQTNAGGTSQNAASSRPVTHYRVSVSTENVSSTPLSDERKKVYGSETYKMFGIVNMDILERLKEKVEKELSGYEDPFDRKDDNADKKKGTGKKKDSDNKKKDSDKKNDNVRYLALSRVSHILDTFIRNYDEKKAEDKYNISDNDLENFIEAVEALVRFEENSVSNDVSELKYGDDGFAKYDDPNHKEVIAVLNNTGAFDHMRSGEVKQGTRITFAIHPNFTFNGHGTLIRKEDGSIALKDGNVMFDSPVIWIVREDESTSANGEDPTFKGYPHQVLNVFDQSFRSAFFNEKKGLLDDIRNKFKEWYKESGGNGVFTYEFKKGEHLEIDQITDGVVPFERKAEKETNDDYEEGNSVNALFKWNDNMNCYVDDNGKPVVFMKKADNNKGDNKSDNNNDGNQDFESSLGTKDETYEATSPVNEVIEQYKVPGGNPILLGIRSALGKTIISFMVKKRSLSKLSDEDLRKLTETSWGKKVIDELLKDYKNSKTENMVLPKYSRLLHLGKMKIGNSLNKEEVLLTIQYKFNSNIYQIGYYNETKSFIPITSLTFEVDGTDEEQVSKIKDEDYVKEKLPDILFQILKFGQKNKDVITVGFSFNAINGISKNKDEISVSLKDIMDTGMFYIPNAIPGRIRPEQIDFVAILAEESEDTYQSTHDDISAREEQQQKQAEETSEENVANIVYDSTKDKVGVETVAQDESKVKTEETKDGIIDVDINREKGNLFKSRFLSTEDKTDATESTNSPEQKTENQKSNDTPSMAITVDRTKVDKKEKKKTKRQKLLDTIKKEKAKLTFEYLGWKDYLKIEKWILNDPENKNLSYQDAVDRWNNMEPEERKNVLGCN